MKRSKVGAIVGAALALVIAASLFTGIAPVSAGSNDVHAHWQLVASPNVGNGDNVLNSAYASDTNNVWTVGYYMNKYNHAQTLVEHGYLSGKTGDQNLYGWSVVNSPNPGSDNYLNSIAYARNTPSPTNHDVAWAVGYYINTSSGNAYKQALIARSPAAGSLAGWTNSSLKPTNYDTVLNGVAGSNSDNYFAVGYYFNKTLGLNQNLILQWNGSNWSEVYSPSRTGFNSYLTAVSVLDNHTAWAVGYYMDKLQVQHSILLKWNGASWKDFSKELPPYAGANLMNGVSFNPASSNAWLVGFDSQKVAPIAYFHDYRGKWVMNNPTVGQLTGIDFTSPSAAWTVGYAATATGSQDRAYYWDGTAWAENSPISVGTISQALLSVNGVSGSDMWAVGWMISNGHYVTQVQHYN